jgi:hypothetical protein
MIKTVLLVPIRDNEDRQFPRTLRRHLEDRLLQFGGLSRKRNVTGVWRSGSNTYRDISVQYTVVVARAGDGATGQPATLAPES